MNPSTSRFAPACSGRVLVAAMLATAGIPRSLAAQDPPSQTDGRVFPADVWSFLADTSRAAWARPLASAVIPGLGQMLGGRDRGAVYLVTEVFLLARFITEQQQGNRDGDRYRDLAFNIARIGFAPVIRDTAFGYFEEMARFIESGPFDTDAGPALTPPWDDVSYNGRVWLLARETFFANPDSVPNPESVEYQRALAFYRSRAIGPNFTWSWRGAALEHDLFRLTIRSSDQGFRRATRYLGLLLANHLLSAVDAYVSARLSANGRGARVEARVVRPAPAREPALVLGLGVPF